MQPSIKKNNVGIIVGFILAASIATVILYFILKTLDKLPTSWSISHIVLIVIAIAIIAAITSKGITIKTNTLSASIINFLNSVKFFFFETNKNIPNFKPIAI